MRILHLVSIDPRSGHGHAAIRGKALARVWTKQGHEVVTLFPGKKSECEQDPVLGTMLSCNPREFPRSLWQKLSTRYLPYQFRQFSKEFIEASFAQAQKLGPFDFVIADELTMAFWGEKAKSAGSKFVYVSHNFEAELYQQIEGASFLKRIGFKALSEWEKRAVVSSDVVFAFSEVDQKKLIAAYGRKDILLTRAGVEGRSKNAFATNRNGMIFVGALDYSPNISGLEWFIKSVYPNVRELCPLTVVGRNPSEHLKSFCAEHSVKLIANPPEVESLRLKSKIEVVPLFKGSGTRGKILEACAAGACVIATSKGVEGLSLSANSEYMLADTISDWTSAIIKLHSDDLMANQMRRAAWERMENYLYEQVGQDLIGEIKKATGYREASPQSAYPLRTKRA